MIERFHSERLAFRPQRVEDAEALHEAYRDPGLMRYWSSAHHASVAETVDYLQPRVDHPDWRGWSVTLRGDDRAIGTVSAGKRRDGVAEIGFLFARSHWGRGYGREAVARLLDLLFRDWNYRRVYADTDPDNAASIRMLEGLGFVREGVLRADWETHIGVRDALILGLLRDEWLARPNVSS